MITTVFAVHMRFITIFKLGFRIGGIIKMLDKIRWGFIGCGRVVEQKSGIAFNNVNNSCIHSIMRRNLEAAYKSSKRFSAPNWYDNIEELLVSDIDAVYIATPPGLHYEQALKCCEANKPIYIEKPFARNYEEAKAIVEAFEKKNLPVYVGHYRRALPRFKKIKQLLEEKRIGTICAVDFFLNRIFSQYEADNTWLYNPILSGGGKFFDIAAHTIDMINYLFGDIKEINGFAKNSGTDCPLEDNVTFSFVTVRDIIGSANFNCISNTKKDRMFVIGTEGIMEFSIHGRYDIIIKDYISNTVEVIDIPDPKIVEEPMIQTVVDSLLKYGNCPCEGKDALPTYWAIDRVLEAFYSGRNDDFWNHPERWG